MLRDRYLTSFIIEDLKDKMVFIGGPRQVGKTTLCRSLIATHFREYAYFNWDNRSDRKIITTSSWPGDAELLIFDEIHKYRQWKGFIKGEYDKLKDTYKFIITGSARLDLYRRGGDSLQGRYHYYRLHPFTLAEIEGLTYKTSIRAELPIGKDYHQDAMEVLDAFGGLDATLGNISDPADWEHFTDDSTYIEWESIFGTESEIASGGSLTFLLSSDTQLGNLYYEALFTGGSKTSGTSLPASIPVPEPSAILLLVSGIVVLAGIKRMCLM